MNYLYNANLISYVNSPYWLAQIVFKSNIWTDSSAIMKFLMIIIEAVS